MKKRNSILNKLRRMRAKYIDIYIDNSYALTERMQSLLDKNNIDQKELAKRLNKKESEISKWMSGSHNFTLKTLAKIEDVLGDKLIDVINEGTETHSEAVTFHYLDNRAFIYKLEQVEGMNKQAYSSRFKNIRSPFATC